MATMRYFDHMLVCHNEGSVRQCVDTVDSYTDSSWPAHSVHDLRGIGLGSAESAGIERGHWICGRHRDEPETGPLTESASDEPVSDEKPEPPDPGDDAQERPRTPAIERMHKEELKRRYASHCQMCLCDSLPQELAPAGSYIEPDEVRRSVIDAHHVDAKAGGGAQHGGNLILLCTLHHRNLGARLTRSLVTTALRGKPQKATKRFPGDAVAEGRVVELELGDTGEVIHLFFTDDHAEYWLSADVECDAT